MSAVMDPAVLISERKSQRARQPRLARKARGSAAISFATLVGLLAFWVIATRYHFASALFLPSPSDVVAQAVAVASDGYANGTLLDHILASLGRIGVALAVGIGLGIPVGLLMGLNRWAKGVLGVPIDIYWGLPPLAYLPLMIIWLGIGEASKVVLLSLAAFAPICFAAQAGVRSVPQERINAARSLGATSYQVFKTIIFPSALPEIFTGVRIAIGATLSTLVAAELIAAQSGVGYMIMSAANFLATDVVFVGLIVIAILAFIFATGMRFLEHRIAPWKGKL